MLRSQSNESIPGQHEPHPVGARLDVPCAVYNIDTRWPFAAWAPADSDSPCEVVPSFEDPGARRVHTCHGEVLRIACLDGLVEGEVVLPSRLVSMENFRNRGEEEPLQASVLAKRVRQR